MQKILDLSELPRDPIEALLWLSGVHEQVTKELDPAWAAAYGQARLTGRLDEAQALGLHSHKRVMAYTRRWNEATGRQIKWGDQRG